VQRRRPRRHRGGGGDHPVGARAEADAVGAAGDIGAHRGQPHGGGPQRARREGPRGIAAAASASGGEAAAALEPKWAVVAEYCRRDGVQRRPRV
ncbi:unnamed protein product, partial [Urochloa humidicola]